MGAVVNDIRQGRAAEGASTITQQLARVSFLTRDKTLRRKVREDILAQRIEKLYSKDEILEIYLNKVYFGDGLYGAEAAARGAGCWHAASITRTGTVTYKSMVYTDYFVRGTEPERTCAVHAAQYRPYPEPYFALSVFEGVDLALTARPAPPDPVPAAIPAAPRVEQNPASALPPPAPPETLPGRTIIND